MQGCTRGRAHDESSDLGQVVILRGGKQTARKARMQLIGFCRGEFQKGAQKATQGGAIDDLSTGRGKSLGARQAARSPAEGTKQAPSSGVGAPGWLRLPWAPPSDQAGQNTENHHMADNKSCSRQAGVQAQQRHDLQALLQRAAGGGCVRCHALQRAWPGGGQAQPLASLEQAGGGQDGGADACKGGGQGRLARQGDCSHGHDLQQLALLQRLQERGGEGGCEAVCAVAGGSRGQAGARCPIAQQALPSTCSPHKIQHRHAPAGCSPGAPGTAAARAERTQRPCRRPARPPCAPPLRAPAADGSCARK